MRGGEWVPKSGERGLVIAPLRSGGGDLPGGLERAKGASTSIDRVARSVWLFPGLSFRSIWITVLVDSRNSE